MRIDIGLKETMAAETSISTLTDDSKIIVRSENLVQLVCEGWGFDEIAWLIFHGKAIKSGGGDHCAVLLSQEERVMAETAFSRARQWSDDGGESMARAISRFACVGKFPNFPLTYRDVIVSHIVYLAVASSVLAESNDFRLPRAITDPINVLCDNVELLRNKNTAMYFKRIACLMIEHELNASSFAARITSSSGGSLWACMLAAMCAWSGGRHGAANREFFQQFFGDRDFSVNRAEERVRNRLRRNKKVPGFGHRVHLKDPRSNEMKKIAEHMNEENDDVIRACETIEGVMAAEKGIYANCDLYASVAFYGMGFHERVYPLLLSIGRYIGWAAHAIEQHRQGVIIRPRGRFVETEEALV